MLLSVVFSFRNEEGNISELVSRVSEVILGIEGMNYEIIFVNDSSTDRSFEILADLQNKYPITIINMSRKFGVMPCVLAGLKHTRGDIVVYMDSDLQDPPELIPELVKRHKNGAEVVHTTRAHREGESAFKMWLTSKAYRVINYFSSIELPVNTGEFKLLSRRAVDQILQLDEYDPYMRGLSVWIGFKQDYVFYSREKRHSGVTHFPIFGKGPVVEFIRGLTAYSATPLYMSLFIGLIASFVSVMIILFALVTKLIGISAPGASSTLITVAFFGGLILMSNGILGIYISKIYYETTGRPRYIIESIIKPDDHK